MPAIRANSVLPARREAITLHTADGLSLVGELALPEDRDPVATLVCLHPLPTHGGMMDSHVFRKMAWRLPALAHVAILRFNTRGTTSAAGTSEGAFDEARGEGRDLAAAIEPALLRVGVSVSVGVSPKTNWSSISTMTPMTFISLSPAMCGC